MVYQLRVISDTVQSIRNIVLFWVVLSIVCGVVGGIYFDMKYSKAAEDAQRVHRQLEQQFDKLKR
jgi:phosphate/sulfate permease